MSDHIARNAARAIKHDDIRTLVRALRENGAVWYAPDQSYRNKGAAMVPFFGIPAATTTSTSRLARMTGAAVLTYFPLRRPGTQGYRVFIGPELQNFPSEDPVADTARFGSLLEAQIRDHPEQYLWIHRRFKRQPDGSSPYEDRPFRPGSVSAASARCWASSTFAYLRQGSIEWVRAAKYPAQPSRK